jgi:hypothetical protein
MQPCNAELDRLNVIAIDVRLSFDRLTCSCLISVDKGEPRRPA